MTKLLGMEQESISRLESSADQAAVSEAGGGVAGAVSFVV